MNILKGTIQKISTEGHISLISIQCGQDVFSSLVIENQESAPYLKVGYPVQMYFKETEVILSKEGELPTSLNNVFSCVITEIIIGKILSKVYLQYGAEEVHAIITTAPLEKLKIKAGDAIFALIKNNEIMLSS